MSIEPADVTVAFLTGMILGAGYLAILWGSIRGLARSRRPIVRLLGGAVLRLGLVLGSFYVIMDGEPERLLACLGGFIAVRMAVARWANGPPAPKSAG